MVHIVWGVILASGKDEQLSTGVDTAFLNLGGRPLLSYSLEAFENCPEIDGVAIVAPKDRLAEVQRMVQLFGYSKVRRIAAGTNQRGTSLKAGISCIDEDVSVVVIHECSRPCVSADLISETVRSAKRYGCAVAAQKLENAVKITEKGQKVSKTLEGVTAWLSQTPQAFKRDILEKALDSASKKNITLVDEAMAIEKIRKPVHVVPATANNFKVTSPTELGMAEALFRL